MPDFWSVAVLAVLLVLVGPIVALVLAASANRRASDALRRLELLERRIDEALAGAAPNGARMATAPAATEIPEADASEGMAPVVPEQPAGLSVGATSTGSPGLGTQPIAPEPPPPPPPPRESLESKIGARWSVLVGGLALAFGAIFLVRYSIEAGLLGPAARIVLGFLLAAALFVAGEILRRRDRARGAPVIAKADIPAILTGAGGIAAFATIYAAYALYGFIGDAAAFVLLTLAGLATLFLSVVHGPALAALGALGSYVAPLLVSSATPKPFPVVLHTLAVTAAVLGMARIRGWRWLAIVGIAASLVWGFLVGLIGNVNTTAAEMLLLAGLTAVYVATLVAGGPTSLRDRQPDAIALLALSGVAALSVIYVLINDVYPPLISGLVLAGALGAVASRWTSVAGAAVIAGLLGVLTVMLLRVPGTDYELMRIGAQEWYILGDEGLGGFGCKAAAVALLLGIGSVLSAHRAAATAPRSAGFFAAAGAGAPLVILAVVYLRNVPFQTRPGIGVAALVLAGAFAAITERLIARRPADFTAPAPAFYAAGAVLSLSFAVSVGLETRFIPLALALGAAGVAWVYTYRPVVALPWLAVFCAALACVALIAGPPLSPEALGTTPILNGLILRFGLPAAAVLTAGEILRRNDDGMPAGLLGAIGLALAAFFVALEIRHFANDGVLAAGVPGLGEQSALTLAALAFSLGLQRIASRTGSALYRGASLAVGIVGAATIVIAHFITANPLFTGENVGDGAVFNLLLPGYLLPALLAAWVAAAARPVRPRPYVLGLAALALALGFAYVTLTVRHAFHGGQLGLGPVTDAENWTYSAVWLGFGIALLAAGIVLRSTMVRAASGAIIAVVVLKVFLFDMAALTGALRAASFLGLGAVLIVIGRLYQRLLTGQRTESSPLAPAGSG